MSIVYLAAGDSVGLYGSGSVYGSNGRERVLLHGDARDVSISSTVEQVHFAGSSLQYQFAGRSGRLEIWKDGVRVASLTAAGGADAHFADGAASLAVDAATGAIFLGGQLLGTEPAALSIPLDASRTSDTSETPAMPDPDPAPAPAPAPDPEPEPDRLPSRPSLPGGDDAPGTPGGDGRPGAPNGDGRPSLPDGDDDSRDGDDGKPEDTAQDGGASEDGGNRDDAAQEGGDGAGGGDGTTEDGGGTSDGGDGAGDDGTQDSGSGDDTQKDDTQDGGETEDSGGSGNASGGGTENGGSGGGTGPAPKVPAWLEPGDPIAATDPDRLEGRPDGGSFQDPINIMGIHSGTLSNLSIHDANDADYFKIRLDSHGTEDNFVRIDFAGHRGLKLWVVPAGGGETINPGYQLVNTETFSLRDLEAGNYVVYVKSYGGAGAYSLSWNTEGDLEFPDAAPTDIRTSLSSTFSSGTDTSFISTLEGLTADSFPENRLELDGIVDAEKSSTNTTDDEMCWAASTSNMLAVTGWGELGLVNRGLRDDKPLEDDIFDLFRDRHEPGGSNVQHGIEWFFAQTGLPSMGLDYRYQGFTDFPEIGYEAPSSRTAIAEIAGALADGGAASLSLAGIAYGQDLAHAVTCYGVRWDTARGQDDPTRFTGLYLADSDNDYVFADPTRAPNALQLVDCSYDADADQWILENYTSWDGDRVILSGFATLNSHPGIAGAQPVTASGVPDADEAAILA